MTTSDKNAEESLIIYNKGQEDAKNLIQHKNILTRRLKETELSILRNLNSIGNYNSSELSEEYVDSNIKKLSLRNEELENEKTIYEYRIKEVEKGNLDSDLCQEFIDDEKKVEKNHLYKMFQKKEQLAQKALDKEKYDRFCSTDKEERQLIRQTRFEAKKAFFHYEKILETLPDYLVSNLENMPCNKGYKFRGVIFFGEKPSESDEEIVIFERINKEVLHIHTWTKDFSYLYEKKGKAKKVLLEKKSKKKSRENTLGEYFNF